MTTYYYDPITGFLNGINQPLVGTTTYTDHDPLGNPRTVTDPNGNATTYTYDDIGRVLTVKAPGDTAATQYAYVSAGCTSCGGGASNKIDYIILPEGNKIDYDYDTYGNLIKISDNVGNSVNYTYDSEGNRLTEDIRDASGALQKTLSYQYDALNRLKRINNPDTSYTEYAYDFRGNRKSVKDPRGNTTTYNYDTLSRLTAVIQPGSVTTSYEYNSNRNLTKVIDANNNTTVYKYDDRGKIYQVISPDTGTTTYSYDSAGNMTSKTDAKGITTTYSYDALNRLTKIDFSTDTDILYSYDNCPNGKGRLCQVQDQAGTTSLEYNAKGQTTKETKIIGGITYITTYAYNMNGNITSITYPSGRLVNYSYNTSDKVSAVSTTMSGVTTPLASSIAYKPYGGVSSLTYGNGIASTIGYDNQYRIASITAGTAMNLAYTDDANGNVTAITNALDPTKNKSFTYDALDRLTTANGSWGSLGWTYDGAGNRQTETNGGTSTYAYQTGTNKLTSITGAVSSNFTFDSNGNTATENSREFIYNQNQRLIRIVDAGVTKGEYVYNGYNERLKKVVNSQTTIFHYNLDGFLIAESNSAGSIIAEYVYLNDQPLAKIEGTDTFYIHSDHHGTPQKMTDGTGQVVWDFDFKPFGEAITITGTATNNLRFVGEYYDAETGLHYNYSRDRNPVIGRYLEADPVGIKKGRNHLYVSLENNPIKFIDPKGLSIFQHWPFNGNLYPGSYPQDNECSLQMLGSSINNAANNNKCIKDCCKKHDDCYTTFNCNASSWFGTLPGLPGFTGPCTVCNQIAVDCVASAIANGCDDPPCKK